MIVYLIRHGQSEHNLLHQEASTRAEYMARARPDPSLTEIGHKQAQLVAEHLLSEQHIDRVVGAKAHLDWSGYNISQLYCSPMRRTLETTLPISQALGLDPQLWVGIHEHGGLFSWNSDDETDVTNHPGLSRTQILADFPGYQLVDEVTDDGWWYGSRESLADCMGRATRVAYELRERAKMQWGQGNPDVIALVSHGTFMDCLLKALLYKLPDVSSHFRHYNTAITRINFLENDHIQLQYINRTQHLQPGYLTV